MSTARFHKAAKDGILEVLKEATRSDCNARDETGMTPTLWAAFEGKLDALRLLVGRGGDPDKADHFGNSCLHLAAARGHSGCVTFLINFGVNIFALDIDDHTPKELAGINNREDILRILDATSAKLETTDKKKVKAMKEKAKKDAEKRLKKYNKRQAKADHLAEKEMRKLSRVEPRPSNVLSTLKQRMIKSGSMSNLTGVGVAGSVGSAGGHAMARPSFSAMVGGGTISSQRSTTSTVQKKAIAAATRSRLGNHNPSDFKIGEIEDGKRSVRSLKGVQRDSEVMYVGAYDTNRRSRIPNFSEPHNEGGTTLTRSLSQPDFMQNPELSMDVVLQEPASIFDRPGMGSISFTKSITNTLNAFTPLNGEQGVSEECSIGSAGSLAARQRLRNTWEDDMSDTESSDSDSPNGPLERFLTAWGLGEHTQKFVDEKIDLDALMLLTDTDIKSLGLPLGHFRKLVTAISERKAALQAPGEVKDSPL